MNLTSNGNILLIYFTTLQIIIHNNISMANKTLKIIISKNKNKDKILIHKNNVSESCDKLLKAYKNNCKIKHPLQWDCRDKNDHILINNIGIHIILKLNNENELFEKNKYSICQIENLDFFMNLIFGNNLIIKNWCKDETKWKPLFDFFAILLSHKHLMNPKFLSLTSLIAKTQIYWNINHIKYFHKIKLYKPLCIGIKKAYYANHPKKMHNIVCTLTYNFRIIMNRSTKDKIWYRVYKHYMDKTLISQIGRTHRRRRKKWQMHVQGFCHYKFALFVEGYLNTVYDNSDNKMRQTYTAHKVCAYLNCNKLKTKKNKIKMKICKGCMLVYYCSRNCQKRDWKSKHRKQCQTLCLM